MTVTATATAILRLLLGFSSVQFSSCRFTITINCIPYSILTLVFRDSSTGLYSTSTANSSSIRLNEDYVIISISTTRILCLRFTIYRLLSSKMMIACYSIFLFCFVLFDFDTVIAILL